MFLNFITLYYVVLLQIIGYTFLPTDIKCRTFDGGEGQVKLATNCKPLTDYLLAAPRPLSEETKAELAKFRWGVDLPVRVCCPSNLVLSHRHRNLSTVDEECKTPDGHPENCTAARNCKPLTDFLSVIPRPLSQEVKTELARYQCRNYETPKICCSSLSRGLDKMRVSSTKHNTDLYKNTSNCPPDVTNHENVHLLPTECGQMHYTDKIIGGDAAGLNEFPWMALILYNVDGRSRFLCGGTIINKRYILTAAHCLARKRYAPQSVRVGEYRISTVTDCEIDGNDTTICMNGTVQDLDIEKVIVHSKYSSTRSAHNDIGLLRVAEMNTDPENVRPICLPLSKETRSAKFNFGVVTGWGLKDNYYTTADVLQKIDLPVTNFTRCKELYKGYSFYLSHKQMCLGGEDKPRDSCKGDSGGPVQIAVVVNNDVRYVQQGIVSIGHRLCGTGLPGVYTRIPYYMDWILDNIKP